MNATKQFILVLILASFSIGCQKLNEFATEEIIFNQIAPDDDTAQTLLAWNNIHLRLVKMNPDFTPPVAARSFGYMHLAIYESLVQGGRVNKSVWDTLKIDAVRPVLNKRQLYNWDLVVNATAANMLSSFFTSTPSRNLIDSMHNATLARYSWEAAQVREASANWGKEIARLVFNWSATDLVGHNGHLKNTDPTYVAPVGPSLWVPTGPAFLPALQPRWGNARLFVARNTAPTVSITAPPSFSTSPTSLYFQSQQEVFVTSINLTNAQRQTALYWQDGPGSVTPPGHSLHIAQQVLTARQSNLMQAAEVLCKLSLALNDAFVFTWRTKYQFNTMRPITYIQRFISPTWQPFLTTPNFPDFPSGHATQAGAAAQVLSHEFGFDASFTDRYEAFPSRTYVNFLEYAREVAQARLFGGTNIRNSVEAGVDAGMQIGRNITRLPFK